MVAFSLLRRSFFVDHRTEPAYRPGGSGLKTWLQGTQHGVSPEHLQLYLDEFVFRHNRRRTPMAAFQTLLGLGALHEPTTYREITSRA